MTYSELVNAFSKIRDNSGIRKAASLLHGIVERLLPAGGTTGQALVKASNANYDVTWSSASGGGAYRQFTYEVSAGDFHFIKEGSTDLPVMALLPLE